MAHLYDWLYYQILISSSINICFGQLVVCFALIHLFNQEMFFGHFLDLKVW